MLQEWWQLGVVAYDHIASINYMYIYVCVSCVPITHTNHVCTYVRSMKLFINFPTEYAFKYVAYTYYS